MKNQKTPKFVPYLKALIIIILLYFLFTLNINLFADDSRYKKNVTMNSIFSIQFDNNSWIIESIDKDYLTLVSKDITYDTVTFHFKPKKAGNTNIEFYNLMKKGSIVYQIEINEKINVNPGYMSSFIETTNLTSPNNSVSNFDIAFFLFSNGMYQDAINYFVKGKESEPSLYQQIGVSRISYYLGVCYFNLKQYSTASSYFAISKLSNITEIQIYSYYYMAKTQILLGNLDIAIDNLFYLIYRLKPEDPLFDNSYFLISSIFFEKKDYEHIILLLYPKIDILDNSLYKDYFNYYLALAYYDGRKDYTISYSFLIKITNTSFEYYQKVLEMIKNIQTNFLDFH